MILLSRDFALPPGGMRPMWSISWLLVFFVPGKAELTVQLTRIMIPFLLLIALAVQAMGNLNALNNFAVPALASAFFNIGSILGGLGLGFPRSNFRSQCHRRHGVRHPRRRLSSIRRAVAESAPRRFQIPSHAEFTIRACARSSLDGARDHRHRRGSNQCFRQHQFRFGIIDPATGAVLNGPVSWLSYAFRFMQFPIGVFGVAIATAALPPLSRSTTIRTMSNFAKHWRTRWRWFFSCAFPPRSVWRF